MFRFPALQSRQRSCRTITANDSLNIKYTSVLFAPQHFTCFGGFFYDSRQSKYSEVYAVNMIYKPLHRPAADFAPYQMSILLYNKILQQCIIIYPLATNSLSSIKCNPFNSPLLLCGELYYKDSCNTTKISP